MKSLFCFLGFSRNDSLNAEESERRRQQRFLTDFCRRKEEEGKGKTHKPECSFDRLFFRLTQFFLGVNDAKRNSFMNLAQKDAGNALFSTSKTG